MYGFSQLLDICGYDLRIYYLYCTLYCHVDTNKLTYLLTYLICACFRICSLAEFLTLDGQEQLLLATSYCVAKVI